MSEGKQTVAGAYAKIESHEAECTLRYEALNLAINGVKGEAESIKRGIRTGLMMLGSIALSLIVWLAAQLYGYIQRDIAAVSRPAAVTSAPTVGLAVTTPGISTP